MTTHIRRRHFIVAQAAWLAGGVWADVPKVQTLDGVLKWLDRLEKAESVKSTTTWTMNEVFEHLSQSVEMSLDGFPKPNSALFQNTVGTAAFALFKWRGQMSHGLAEPIPGAPALTLRADWRHGAERLRKAIKRFNAHTGALKPHFAYGSLSKSDFAIAHVLHVANHQDEIAVT